MYLLFCFAIIIYAITPQAVEVNLLRLLSMMRLSNLNLVQGGKYFVNKACFNSFSCIIVIAYKCT